MFGFLSLALGAVSTGLSIFGGMEQKEGEAKQSKALKAEEAARHKQFILDFQRQKLEAVRNAIITRSVAAAAGANQGATGSSSVLSGMGNAANKAAYTLEGLGQNQSIGEEVFKARQEYYDAGGQVAFGQGLSTLGGAIGSNIDTIAKIGTWGIGKLSGSGSSSQTSSNGLTDLGYING